jgi:hypothetical protein
MPTPSSRAIALASLLIAVAPLARAAVLVPLTFSGGGGTPLTITVTQPITYVVTATPAGGILFDFKSVGNLFNGTVNVTGSMTYSVNGGAANTITTGTTGAAAGTIAATDLLLFHNPATAAALNNTIVLSAGSVTTAVNVGSAAPANGSFAATLVDQSGNQVGTGSVPEPATATTLAAATALTLLQRRRRPD